MHKVYFKNISQIIRNLLADSEYEIKIAVAWFSDIYLIKELEKCLERGVKVSIIFYDKSNDKGLFENLYHKNAKIATTRKLMHNKFCVIDNKIIINGSYNWTYSARSNHENIQVTNSKKIAQEFSDEFENILNSNSTSYEPTHNHFGDKQEAFLKYFEKQIKPITFPLFYKQSFTKTLKYKIQERRFLKQEIPFDHFYKFIKDYEAYLAFHEMLYKLLYSKEPDLYPSFNFLYSYIDEKSINGKSFIILDFILDEPLKIITSDTYDNNEFRCFTKELFYFNDYTKENFLVIGIQRFANSYNYKGYELEIRLLSHRDFPSGEKLGYLEYGDITINENEILFGGGFAKVYVGDVSYDSSEVQTNYDKVINKKDYQINIERSNENKENAIRKKRNDQFNKFEKLKNQKKEKIRNSNDCYIATMVYNNSYHPNVISLRHFRNKVLLNNKLGVVFVKLYYSLSPIFVSIFKNNKSVNSISKFIIEKLILPFIK